MEAGSWKLDKYETALQALILQVSGLYKLRKRRSIEDAAMITSCRTTRVGRVPVGSYRATVQQRYPPPTVNLLR